MSLKILYMDEMKGFYRSKVMLVLWIGLPLLSILFHYFQPNTSGLPLSYLVSLLISSIGGTLAAVTLSTSIVGEKNKHVYDLFLIRPVKRGNIILAKFLAIYTCLVIAAFISLLFGTIIDISVSGLPTTTLIKESLNSLGMSFAAMAISCSVGILFAMVVNSIAVAAILAVYVGNNLSALPLLPALLVPNMNPLLFTGVLGIAITVVLMALNIMIFNKKQF